MYEELFDISIKWHELGLQFGIKNAELKKIAAQNLNPDQALCKMVETWLQTMDKPTWEFIVEKLRNRTIQESVLANDIERKYCGMLISELVTFIVCLIRGPGYRSVFSEIFCSLFFNYVQY